jgi:hypothetical protein
MKQLSACARIAFVVAFVIVLVLSLSPASHSMQAPGNDKLHHIAAFLVLSALGLRGWPDRSRELLAGLAIAAVLIELLQGTEYIGRDRELGDMAADGAGIVTGVLLLALYSAMRRS